MSKFNTRSVTPAKAAPGRSYVTTDKRVRTTTALGGDGYTRDAKSELFLLGVANMVSEQNFHEAAGDRDQRFKNLIATVVREDPEWVIGFFGWLRSEANMRSAAVVGALEAARALVKANIPGGRDVVSAALQRADEPGEAIAYWLSNYGTKIPKPIKRGIADAVVRLWNEYAVLKYNTSSRAITFDRILNLVHPEKKAPYQTQLFQYILDRRYAPEREPGELLTMVRNQIQLRRAVTSGRPEALLSWQNIKAAGFTWEDALSLAGNKVSKAKLWEAMIPNMGIMALIRNLRNFDETGVSDKAAQLVMSLLQDPETIAKSRQFPFRFLAAHRATSHSLRWGYPLERALQLSLTNIPELPGRTLVLVDRSGSMFTTMSAKSELSRADAAAVFGAALAVRNIGRLDLIQYGTTSAKVKVRAGDSVLNLVNTFGNLGGTATWASVKAHYAGHDRVIIITDEQTGDHYADSIIPPKVPLYTWNLGGYRVAHAPGYGNRHTFGGLTDQAFKVIPLLERGANADWPWMEGQE